MYVYIFIAIYLDPGQKATKSAPPAEAAGSSGSCRRVTTSGVHKGGLSKGGFGNKTVTINT